MEKRKAVGPTPVKNNAGMHRAASSSAIGNKVSSVTSLKDKGRLSEGGDMIDSLPPKPPPTATAGGGNTAKTGLRLGGLSRYLLEKAQSNDSGLDLSPGTLQTLVHPLRTSNSSSSSLHVRNLFESPASSTGELSHGSGSFIVPDSGSSNPPAPSIPSNALAEQSHNASTTETTIIEKTLTEEHNSNNDISKRNALTPISEHEQCPPNTAKSKYKENLAPVKNQKQSYPNNHSHPDDVTPNNGGFHVPQSRTKRSSSGCYSEDTDPYQKATTCTQSNHHNQQNNSFPSSDAAAVKSVAPEQTRKNAMQTPKPKSVTKKKIGGVPSSAKKPSGSSGSAWKFLSEHVQNQEFLILQQLGKGGCGEVSLVMEKDSKKQFALKIVQLHGIDEALVQECINEVEMLIDLKGTDLVVDIFNWEFDRGEKTMKILMENGQCDLNHTILRAKQTKKPIKLIKMRYIWESMLTIVQEIHSKGIVHADLKPANFVWFNDNLKIIDFGIASRLQSDLTSIAMPNPKGTLNFISPEIIRQDDNGRSKLSPKSDIWALGCILYLMVYGRTPFEHITHPVSKMSAIVQGEVVYPQLPSHLLGSDVVSVLKLCFQTDYKRRPSAAELLRHSFLQG